MHPLSWAVVLAVANVPVYAALGALVFRSRDEFRRAVPFRPAPGFAFLFRGEFRKEWRAELKLALFMIVCAAIVYVEYAGLRGLARP